MNAQTGGWITKGSESSGENWKRRVRVACAGLLLGGAALAMSGCAGYYEPGFGATYYSPDYGPYYGDYGYSYSPWDFGGYGGDIFIGGVRHHGYYGGHHFGHEFHGGGFHGGGFHGGGGHGGHR